MRRWGVLLGATLAAGVIAGAGSGALVALLLDEDGGAEPAPVATAQPPPPNLAEAAVEAAHRALPSVVTILLGGTGEGQPTGVGSGVILDERGYIVTNEHVIAGTTDIRVVLFSGEERPAVVVGDDRPFNDLAVIKIDAGGLRSITLADSDQLELGEPVLFLGQTLESLPFSATLGVVSGLHRRFFKDGVFMEDLVQTDAATNTGNSGGALLTLDGKLAGIMMTVVRTGADGSPVQGVSFAISSRTVAEVAGQLIRNGRVARPDLGAAHEPVILESSSSEEVYGALLTAVEPGGAADQGGLRAGDVILSIAGRRLSEERPLLTVLLDLKPGDLVTVEAVREERLMRFQVVLQAL